MNIVVLTGAGISAESGLSTFRNSDGLWEGRLIDEVCTPDALITNPELVCAFYDERRSEVVNAQPNSAHYALADLERHWKEREEGSFLIITQNIDDLHERAGSANVLHMHGELNAASCMDCGWIGSRHSRLEGNRECPICERETLRPDVVLFGESARQISQIETHLKACHLFLAIGTSGTVYPAAGFVDIVSANGADAHCFDLDLPIGGERFTHFHKGPAGQTLPSWVSNFIVE